MRSGVVIGAAMAVLTVRLLTADGGVEPSPRGTAASAAAGVLAHVAGAAVPSSAGAAPADGSATAAPAPLPAVAGGAGPAAASAAARAESGRHAMQAAAVEAQVRQHRARGDGEETVYRLRTTHLPAADVAQLMAMEAAEAAWQRQRNAAPAECAAPCTTTTPDYVVAHAYQRDATPKLTLE